MYGTKNGSLSRQYQIYRDGDFTGQSFATRKATISWIEYYRSAFPEYKWQVRNMLTDTFILEQEPQQHDHQTES